MCVLLNPNHLLHNWSWRISCLGVSGLNTSRLRLFLHLHLSIPIFVYFFYLNGESLLVNQVDSCTESAEAACDILSQLVNCTIKTLGLISTARPSFMDVSQVSLCFMCTSNTSICYTQRAGLVTSCIPFACQAEECNHLPQKIPNFCTFCKNCARLFSKNLKKKRCSGLISTACPSSGPLCVCTDRGVCQLQVPVIYQDWWHAGGRSVPEGAGCQQQWHPEVAEDEQLSSCLPSRSLHFFKGNFLVLLSLVSAIESMLGGTDTQQMSLTGLELGHRKYMASVLNF